MAHEGRTYASRAGKFTPRPETPEERAILDNLSAYAGEQLTVEYIRVILLKSKIIVGVRFDENTAFEIDMFKAEWELLIKEGYTLPTTVGQHPFHAEIITEWVKEFPRGMRHSTIYVYPKAKEIEQPMETVQPETSTPDYAAIISELSRLRDTLVTDITGLTGGALETATAKANAAHYIDNAIGSLQRAFPVPAISGNDVTERIPVADLPAITDTDSVEGEAA